MTDEIKFILKKFGRSYSVVSSNLPQIKNNSKKEKDSGAKKSYRIVPIQTYIDKYVGNVNIETTKDSDMEKYVNDLKKGAYEEDRKNIARTYIVMNENTNNVLGYFTLRIVCLKSDETNKDSNAYEGCNAVNDGHFPAVEILMFAKNDKADFKIAMSDIFRKDIAKMIYKIYQAVGVVYVYLECSRDNKELKKYYQESLKFIEYHDVSGRLEQNNLIGFIQRIEFMKSIR